VVPSAHCYATVNSTTASLNLEQARNASIIAGVAAERGLIARAVSIGLATAFQESDIRNLEHGDLDSLGIFQQRPSQGWGTVEEILDPYYATRKFFDTMVEMVHNWQTADIGDVAQTVQRSGYPDAYDQHVDRARILASALSGETPATWSCIVSNPASADPDGLKAHLNRAYGAQITIETPESGSASQLIVTARSEAVAWSVAAFAQSWATEMGVSKVSVGNHHWQASASVLAGWVANADNPQDATTTIITF
jgi:hypothetical protein